MRPFAVALKWIIVGLLAMTLVTTASAVERNPARTRPAAAADQATTQRIIVKFRQSSTLSVQASKSGEAAAATSADVATRMNALAGRAHITVQSSRAIGGNMHLMFASPLNAGESAAEMLARVEADSDVEGAQLDRRVYLHATDTNDPHYVLNTGADSGQWYLRGTESSAINARAAWDVTKGSNGVVIAVVDTGVLYVHEDLQTAGPTGGKLLPGYDFISPDSSNVFTTANDGNGRDSDPTDPGDFCSTDSSPHSSWHGTRVSGIIGALTNNNIGVSGTNWNGYILPVRVIGRCGGFDSDVLAGILWAAGISVSGAPTNPYPAQVINVSLGGTGSCGTMDADAIRQATAVGALVVVSAGNEGGPVDSPANCPGAVAVLGLRNAGTKVGFSSLGPQIALGAPGGNCVNDIVTNPSLPCVFSIDTSTNAGVNAADANIYTDKTSGNANVGTSFSSPIVSGIAGLMLSVNGNLKSKDLLVRLKEGASPFPTTSTTTTTACQDPANLPSGTVQGAECICNIAVCGAGMANALGAVNAALRPVAAVVVPSNYAAGSSVTLDASGSGAACGRTITNYDWRVVSTAASLGSGPNAKTAMLNAPGSGAATAVQLTITDDAGKTDAISISVGPTSTTSTAPSSTPGTACLNDITPPGGAAITVTIAATDANAAEAAADPGVFTITRSGSTTAALTVSLTYSGTATNGTDYTMLPATATIPAGSASATITVTPVDDSSVEGSETVVATVAAGTGYIPGNAASATVTIADNDTAPAPPPSAGGSSGGKGGGGAVDPLTLIAELAFVICAVLSRRSRQKSRLLPAEIA